MLDILPKLLSLRVLNVSCFFIHSLSFAFMIYLAVVLENPNVDISIKEFKVTFDDFTETDKSIIYNELKSKYDTGRLNEKKFVCSFCANLFS